MGVPGRLGRVLSECGAALQVALDMTGLWEAVRLASLLPRSSMVLLEAGTPLVKSMGLYNVVSALRGVAGDEGVVVADTKTVDAGALEARVAVDAGADAITVVSAAHESTIREASRVASEAGAAVYVDLITSRDPIGDAERASEAGAHVVLLHTGVDVQAYQGLRATGFEGVVRELSGRGLTVAVAGGVKPGEAGRLVEAGASIVIIGGGITRASDPKAAAEEALESMRRAGASCR